MNAEHVTVEVDASQKPRGKGNVRWWIVWTLFFSTVTNYISRQTFSVLGTADHGAIPLDAYRPLQDSWRVSDLVCSHVVAWRHLS